MLKLAGAHAERSETEGTSAGVLRAAAERDTTAAKRTPSQAGHYRKKKTITKCVHG